MKKRKLFLLFGTALISLSLLFAWSGAKAQASCEVTLANDVVIDASHYAFDVYVKSTNNALFPDGFPYGNAAYKWTFNTAIKNTAQSGANARVQGYIVANSTELTNTAQANNVVTNPTATLAYFRIPTRSPVPHAEASIISNSGFGTKIFRFVLVSRDTVAHTYVPFTAGVPANITLTIAPPSGTLVTYVVPAGTVSNTSPQVLVNTNLTNPVLVSAAAAPTAFAMTGGAAYCQGAGGSPVGLANSQLGVNYTLIKDGTPTATVVAGSGAAITFGSQLAGTYTASGTADGSVPAIAGTTAMTGTAVNTETPSSTVEETASACDTYTWAVNGATYTTSGDKTFVDGCVTHILHLTITPSSTVEETASACDTYTWAVNSVTYTTSGDKTVVIGCVTHILHLTITPSSTVEETASACDTYTWAVNSVTYTTSGDKTVVIGCVTHILHLTITPSSTVEETASACDTYTWAVNNATYTTSGDKTVVIGCVTHILHLTITPSSTVEETASACDTYTWALNGATYTTSGDKTFVVGCVTNILHLTITPTVTPSFAAMGPYNQGTVGAFLPTTSTNGVVGVWVPAQVNTAVLGASTYTFTPTAGQCATGTTMSITINEVTPLAATWTGAVSSDWFVAGNWNPAVPGAITAVTIPSGVNNFPTLTAPATVASILINSGGSFIGAEFLTVGTATVKRDFVNNKWHFLTSPVVAATFAGAFNNSTVVWAKEYLTASNTWVYKTGGQPFVLGRGYSVGTSTPTVTAAFTGVMNKTDVTNTMLSANGGWNMLGNPFQSAIDWDLVTKGAGVSPVVNVWTGTNYIVWNSNTQIGGLTNGIIPAQNGFFASTTVNGASITVPLTARVHSAVPFYKQGISNLLELQASGNEATDQMFVHFNDNATAAFDNEFDARKMYGEDYAPQLYSITANDVLAINELPLAGNEIVDLGFKCNTNGEYNLNASGMESFDLSTPILLEDTKSNFVQDLRVNPVYTFSYVAGENANRFKLHFKSTTGIGETANSGISVYSYVHNVVINNATTLAGEVWVYDMTGRVLNHSSLSSTGKTTIPMNVAIGTYMVKVVTSKAIVNQKVFIQ